LLQHMATADYADDADCFVVAAVVSTAEAN
jgi:hypothetical protein